MGNTGYESDSELPAPGSRWGKGAQSVLPYLTKTLQARPAVPATPEPREREAPAAREPHPAPSAR